MQKCLPSSCELYRLFMCYHVCVGKVFLVSRKLFAVDSTAIKSSSCSLKKTFTAERIEELKQLSTQPDIYERLARALGECVHRLPQN